MSTRRWIALALVGVCATMAVGGAWASAASVDKKFGNKGLVLINPVLRGYDIGDVPEIAAGARGIYLLTFAGRCEKEAGLNCKNDTYVTRLKPNGARDRGYGSGGSALVAQQPARSAIAVDSRERAVVASVLGTEVVVVRLTAAGLPDPSFGNDGRAAVPCDCEGMSAYVAVVSGDEVELVARRTDYGGAHEPPTERFLLARLTSTGSLEPRFGEGGLATAEIRGQLDAQEIRALPGGAVVFAGIRYGGTIRNSKIGPFVERFAPDGKLDRRFAVRAGHAIATLNLPKPKELYDVSAVIPRPHGGFDLIGGTASLDGSYVLRMHADGTLERGFGRRGVKLTPADIFDAAADPAGHVLGVGENKRGELAAFWLGRGARPDPPLAVVGGMDSLLTKVVMQGKRPLLFDDNNENGCRSYCAPHPSLVRLNPWERRLPLPQGTR